MEFFKKKSLENKKRAEELRDVIAGINTELAKKRESGANSEDDRSGLNALKTLRGIREAELKKLS